MRVPLAILLTILLVNQVTSNTVFDDELRDFVEFLRLQMRCGYEPAGIPPLAPYETDFKELKIKRNQWDVRANFSEFTIDGLDEFDVQALSFNNVFRKVSFDFNFGKVVAHGDYKMDLLTKEFGPAMHFFGDGPMRLTLENLRVHGSFKFQPNLSGGVYLVGFKIKMEIGDVRSEFTGIQNSKLFSKVFNNWLEEFLNLLVNDNPDEVSAALKSIIVPPLNRAMKNISIVELIALILGLAGDDIIPNQAFC